jgi:hypothetical protein
MTDLVEMIRAILNREDIEGLLAIGAPQDEYDSEAETIGRAIASGDIKPQKQELVEFLKQIWQQSFGPFSEEEWQKREDSIARVAQQISEVLSSKGTWAGTNSKAES